jgi:hypothetical protein
LPDDASAQKYNFIYSKLVEEEDDILGIIAYAFYKRQKISYIKSIQGKHGREPTQQEFEIFQEISNSQLTQYRAQAIELSESFLEQALSEKARELEEFYDNKTQREIRDFRPSYWVGVSQSIIAGILFVLLLGLLIFFTWSLKQGPMQAIEAIFNVTITSKGDVVEQKDNSYLHGSTPAPTPINPETPR